MAEVVNLRLARKRKARAVEDGKAEQNRVLHGRTKAEREAVAKARFNDARKLDGHRLKDE